MTVLAYQKSINPRNAYFFSFNSENQAFAVRKMRRQLQSWTISTGIPIQAEGGRMRPWPRFSPLGGGREGFWAIWFFKYSVDCQLAVYLVQFSRSVVSDSLRPHEPQHTRPPCPSPTPGVYTNLCPLSRWCHPTISSSVFPSSSCPQSFPASGSFQMSQHFASGGQSIGVSALISVLPMNTQDWSPLGWTGWISLRSKGLSRVFSNTTVQKHQFFGAQLSL